MQSYWFLILISLAAAAILKSFLLTLSSAAKGRLPPGPASYPVIGNLIWLKRSVSETETVLRNLHSKIGLTVSLRFGPRLAVFVADRKLAHQALIHNGAVFADRPPPAPLSRITLSNQQNISSSFYGPTWRLLRRNLTSEILHPSRVKCYSHARKWVLHVIKARLVESGRTKRPVQVMEQFQYAMFCLLVFMCFGDKLDEKQISEIERVQLQLLLNNESFGVFSFFPGLAKMVLRKRWSEFLRLRKEQEDVLIPLIRERATKINEDKDEDYVLAYADTLFDLELPDEKRKLTETEMMGLCSEFLIAGADTTATALQWIMANLVKNPQIQNKLLEEIKTLIGNREKIGEGEIGEEELNKLPYLKGVVLEGLRRHPPAHFVLPHAVTEESKLGEYVMPKKGTVNFMVAEMGRDPKVWEDPMSFKPERFVGETAAAFDIKGIKEIKMMPFGAGRRICPGYGLALLHLEYFVANLVWSFDWKAVEGDEVDLSEKQEFTVVMKNPLQANVSPRFGVH
ncbi:Cytochrome P450 89A2 [Linum perenne]